MSVCRLKDDLGAFLSSPFSLSRKVGQVAPNNQSREKKRASNKELNKELLRMNFTESQANVLAIRLRTLPETCALYIRIKLFTPVFVY